MTEPKVPVRAFVCSCDGLELDPEERRFLADTQPWGFILFRRNVESPGQVAALTAAFREAVGREDAPVLVDQEGGRVQRLRPPHWFKFPPAAAYAARHAGDHGAARDLARRGGVLIGHDLRAVGITIDCAPVLDVPVAGSSDIVGDRAFGRDPATVAALARAFAEGLMAAGVLPVIKHCPGHGRAAVDSHLALPVVEARREELETDLAPFRSLADLPIAMTAHVKYRAFDPDRPATTSRLVIERIIRGEIGFDGLLLSDDLSMEALTGSLGERAAAASAAGCDILLHCNGKMAEARQVAAAAPVLDGRAAERAAAALSRLKPAAAIDVAAERAAFAADMGLAAA